MCRTERSNKNRTVAGTGDRELSLADRLNQPSGWLRKPAADYIPASRRTLRERLGFEGWANRARGVDAMGSASG